MKRYENKAKIKTSSKREKKNIQMDDERKKISKKEIWIFVLKKN